MTEPGARPCGLPRRGPRCGLELSVPTRQTTCSITTVISQRKGPRHPPNRRFGTRNYCPHGLAPLHRQTPGQAAHLLFSGGCPSKSAGDLPLVEPGARSRAGDLPCTGAEAMWRAGHLPGSAGPDRKTAGHLPGSAGPDRKTAGHLPTEGVSAQEMQVTWAHAVGRERRGSRHLPGSAKNLEGAHAWGRGSQPLAEEILTRCYDRHCCTRSVFCWHWGAPRALGWPPRPMVGAVGLERALGAVRAANTE